MLDFVKSQQNAVSNETPLARRAWLEVKYTPANGEEKDISEDLSKYLISASFTDNLSDSADDMNLTLEDKAGLWQAEWFPQGEGNFIDATIHTLNRISLSDGEETFHVGKFEIDEVEITGYPSTVQIKGVSVIGEGSLRSEKKNQTWEKIELKKCASDICERNGLTLMFDSEENPTLNHVEQADESDLDFLLKLCKDNGLSLKISTEQIIIFDEAKYESQSPVITVYKPGIFAKFDGVTMPLRWLKSYNFRSKTRDTFAKCKVTYQKGKDKAVIEGEFSAKEKGRTLFIREQVENATEAAKLAKKKLREANKDALTGNFSTIGNTNFAAGIVLAMKNFGEFDGKYIVTKVNHNIGAEYTTQVEFRQCLENY